MEYSNKTFSPMLTWAITIRRLMNHIGFELMNPLCEAIKLFLENTVNDKKCRVVASVMKGLFDYSILLKDNQLKEFYTIYSDVFDVFVNKAQGTDNITEDIFAYEGIIEIPCYSQFIMYYYIYYRHLIDNLNALTNDKTSTVLQVTYLSCICNLYAMLFPLTDKYSDIIVDIAERLSNLIKKYLKSEYSKVIQSAWMLVLTLYNSTYNLRKSQNNKLLPIIDDINNFITNEIKSYNNKYSDKNSFDTFTEGEDNKLVSVISKCLPDQSPLVRDIPYRFLLFIQAVRSNVYYYFNYLDGCK